MTEHNLWRFSRALHRAINERQFAEIENLIDEDIEWTIHGPVEWFPFFGSRRGKAAVMEVIRQIAEKVRVHRFDREQIMLGAESASSMTPGRRLRFIQLLVAEIGRWFQKTIGFFALHKCRGIPDVMGLAAVLTAARWRSRRPARPARRR